MNAREIADLAAATIAAGFASRPDVSTDDIVAFYMDCRGKLVLSLGQSIKRKSPRKSPAKKVNKKLKQLRGDKRRQDEVS